MSQLLRRSHAMSGSDVGSALAELARDAGLEDAAVLLVDVGQSVLVPLPPTKGQPVPVDGTLPGRAFRSLQSVSYPLPDGGVRVWCPLLEGGERLGVLGLTLADDGGVAADDESFEELASLVALLIGAKARVDDLFACTGRVEHISLAAELRWSVLPPLTFAAAGVSLAAMVAPAYRVAGDAFDYAVHDRVLHAAVFDAVGHTLHSTRIADLALSAYRHARRAGTPLADLYAYVDAMLRTETEGAEFVTALLTELDLDSGCFTWSCAGHPAPLRLRGSVVHELSGPRSVPLGLEGPPPALGREILEPGDGVVLYTDGMIEARLPDGEEFGLRRLADHLGRAQLSAEPSAETMRRLGRMFTDTGAELRDDLTLVTLTWSGPS